MATIKRLMYYAIVILLGAFIIYNVYNSTALFSVKADIENKAYQVQQLLDKGRR